MKRMPGLTILLPILVASLSPGAGAAPLDDYVNTPDPAYSYTLLNTVPQAGFTDYILEMTSQTWRDATEVDYPTWKHHLTITVPDTVTTNICELFIGGGSRTSPVPTQAADINGVYATSTSSVIVELKQIPNQNITFLDDPDLKPRKEDDQISYAWKKFLYTGDPLWLSRFPMTKAAVRAMDTVTEFLAQPAYGSLTVDQFVVIGGSKRGWTTWTTAAVDDRVIAFTPCSIELVNLEPSFLHHYACYGFWADAVSEYEDQGIMEWTGSRPYWDLLALVDPYSFFDRYVSKPKYVYNSAGDEFFLPDSSQFYWDDLPGDKYLRYLPNCGHGLDYRVYEDVFAWYQAILDGTPIPSFTWTKQPDGSLVVDTTGTTPSEVLLWQATNSTRDFRYEFYGNLYTSSPLAPSGPDQYTAALAPPPSGFTAFFVEVSYPSSTPYPFKFTTEVSVLPDTYVASWEYDTDEDGLLDSVDTDDDNDGQADSVDYRPRDTDDDALPNHADDDDDNDGFSDADERSAGTDPYDYTSFPGMEQDEVPVGGPVAMIVLAGVIGLIVRRRVWR